MSYELELIRVEIEDGVATATIDNPPVNVMTLPLMRDLIRLGQQVDDDESVRVLVLKSADPDFFIAHFDVEALLQFPVDSEPERNPDSAFNQMCERFRTMDQVTIAQIEGRAGGGGSELVQAFDMRFGVLGKTRFNQMEVPVGILPGGGGTQRLPRLVGRGRALEIILGGDDLDAETATSWGLLNRALAASEIDGFVSRLARRIASFPPDAVRLAKTSVNNADLPLGEGLIEEAFLFDTLVRTPEAQNSMRRFLELGGQTREGEIEVAALSSRVAKE